MKMIVTVDSIRVDYGDQGYEMPACTEDAREVLGALPDLMRLFLEKNRKYAEVERGYDLGDKGIIPDLNRKLGILVARIWHGAAEVGEPTDEVIDDMIGHLMLMKAKRNRGKHT